MPFTLKNGTQLTVEWNLGIVMELDKVDFSNYVDQSEEFSFLQPPEQFFSKWLTNTAFMAALTYYSLLPEEREGMSESDFVQQLNGPAIHDLKETMWEAISDFFQDPRISFLISEMKRKTKVVQEKIESTRERIQNIDDDQIDKAFDLVLDQLEKQQVENFLSLQASLESAPQS